MQYVHHAQFIAVVMGMHARAGQCHNVNGNGCIQTLRYTLVTVFLVQSNEEFTEELLHF